MRRVLVIGSGGSGKSTVASRLAELTGLPLIHLDALYWRPGWIEPDKEEWSRTVAGLSATSAWIMDGNYGGTLEQRLIACDTVIFLDLPRSVCLARVVRRWFRYRGRSRPDMMPNCPERLSWEFVRWIWDYPATRKPKILERLDSLRRDQQAIILDSSAAVEKFLDSVEPVAAR